MHASFRLIIVAVGITACGGADRSQLNIPEDAAASSEVAIDLGPPPDAGEPDVTSPDVTSPDVAPLDVAAPVCGDNVCNGAETCTTCRADCGACPPACGDHMCNGAETCTTCAADCGACHRCGDGVCNGTETCTTCAADCGRCDPCTTAATATCGTCTPNNGCGWCRNVNRCVSGMDTGPTSNVCTRADWAWQRTDCTPVDPCETFTTCGPCAASAACGWCRNVNRCFTGTTTGPNNRMCNTLEWVPQASACPRGA